MADPMKIRAQIKGDVTEIRVLMGHAMETGQRKDAAGKVIARKIINAFTCTLNGKVLFSAELAPAVSANPALNFFFTARESGTLEFKWTDDDGSVYALSRSLTVT